MKKISINRPWLVFLPVIGLFFFVVFPELQKIATNFDKQIAEHEANVQKLESLKEIVSPSVTIKNEIKSLEFLVSAHGSAIGRKKYIYYKHGGTVIIVLCILVVLFGSSYIIKRKKHLQLTNK